MRSADVVVLDLAYAVLTGNKPEGKTSAPESIACVAKGGAEVFVLISNKAAQVELEAFIWPGLSGVIYPKAEGLSEIQKVDRLITKLESDRKVGASAIEIVPLVETAKGVWNLYEIASSSSRIRAIAVACRSLAYDLGVLMNRDWNALAYAVAKAKWVSEVLGLVLILEPLMNGPDTSNIGDNEILHHGLGVARKVGCRSLIVFDPSMVQRINEALTPSDAEVEEARRIIGEFSHAFAEGQVYCKVGERTVDMHVVREAKNLLEWARACRAKDGGKREARESCSKHEDE